MATITEQPMLAKSYDGQDVRGWLISEKLDGVRALWNGKNLVSRNGNVFAAPQWFIDALPAMELDGELHIGRQMFQKTVGIVRKKTPVDSEWRQIKYKVFDAPKQAGGFEKRLDAARKALIGNPFAQVIDQIVCQGKSHLDDIFQNLVGAGAEGVMLRRANSRYEHIRSDNLLKYKPFDTDEAIVVAHKAGTGRLSRSVGSLLCSWKGQQFHVGAGMKDKTRIHAPRIGAAITFSYQGLTDRGIPRFPTLVTERNYE